jgi:hypothetical protein
MECLLSRAKYLCRVAITGQNKSQRFHVCDWAGAAKSASGALCTGGEIAIIAHNQNGGTS